jgi:hypothetical protein
MLIKNILIGMLASLFCLGLAGTVIAGDNEKPYASLGDKSAPMNMENDNIEFDYSPRERASLASVSLMNTDREDIEFDYSPREDSNNTAALSSMNTDSEDIQFDYSPRSVNCGTPYC